MDIKLVVGLGNPEIQYENTRHNIGFRVIDNLCDKLHLKTIEKFKGKYDCENIQGKKVFFLKPLNYMNNSGESVKSLSSFFKIAPEEILVIYDDIETQFGTISFKYGGGLAGHGGLKSIKQHLKTDNFHRLKIGVSRPKQGSVSSYVLGKFTSDQQIVLPLIVEKAVTILIKHLPSNIREAEQKYKKLKVLNQ
jgi:PTH1 family peptidyl-tRNA hydrolase